MDLCGDKQYVKQQREEAKLLRSKIVGVGNTMDSYGERFLSTPYQKIDRSYLERKDYTKNGYFKATKNEEQHNGTIYYDQYNSKLSLNEKLGGIINKVDQVAQNEDNKDKSSNKNKNDKLNCEKVMEFDLLELEPGQFDSQNKNRKDSNINFIDN